MLKKLNSKYFVLVLLILLTLPSVWYLFFNGFIKTDDGNWMIIRFSAFYQTLRDGQFPVRFLGRLNYGYGYPVANFLYPGFMYIGIPLKLVGFGFINVIKLIIGMSVILSGVFTFLWLNKIFKIWDSFFGTLFYIWAPYHLYDVSKRGSVGEILSLAIAPFVLWQIERQDLVLSSLGLAVLLISHNTLAILFLAMIILFMTISLYVEKKKTHLAHFYLKVLLFGFGISSFFILPAIFELGNTVFSKTKISNFNQYFADYNLIGITTFVIVVAAIVPFLLKKGLYKKHYLTLLMSGVAIVTIFFASPLSALLWKFLPVSFIQFPFRILSLTLIAGAFLFAFVLSQLLTKYKFAIGVTLLIATIYFSKDYLLPKMSDEPDTFYSTNEATTTVMDEYMPTWVIQKPSSHFTDKVEIVRGEGSVSNIYYNNRTVGFDYSSASPAVVRINTIYYPGWTAYSNGTQKAIFYDNKYGLIDLKLEQGNQKVVLRFGETPIRILSDLVSLVSFFGLFIMVYKKQVSKLINK